MGRFALRWAGSLALAGFALVGIAVVMLTCVVVVDIAREPDPLPFDQQTWQGASHSSGIRYRMAKDLVSSKVLIGKSHDEVVALLGPSTLQSGRLNYTLGGPTNAFEGFENILTVELREGVAIRAFMHDD